MLNEIIFTNRAVEVTDAVQGVARCYLFIWGDPSNRDSYDTFFDRARPPQYSYKGRIEGTPVLYEHAQDTAVGKHAIGEIIRSWFDDTGLCCEVQLDRSSPFYSRILSEIRSGKLKTSSATTPHAAEFHEDGAFMSWLLAELSFTANPSESRMPAVEIVRSAEQERNVPGATYPLIPNLDYTLRNMEAIMPDLQSPVPAPEAQRAGLEEMLKAAMDAGYTADEIAAALSAMTAPEMPRADAAPEDEEEMPVARSITAADLLAHLSATRGKSEVEALRAENAALKAKRNAAPVQQPRPAHQPAAPRIEVNEPVAYRRLSLADMMFVAQAMTSRREPLSDDFKRAMQMRAADAMEKNQPLFNDVSVRSAMPFKRANEVMTSTAAGFGDEWVAVAYSTELWEKARSPRIYQELVNKGMRVEEIPQGHESIVIFTESSDPTAYTISSNADVDATSRPTVVVGASPAATGNTTLTPGAIGIRTIYNSWFDEDSLIAAAPQLNRQIQEKCEETIEQLMLNGDTVTTATTNINLIDGTPGTGLSKPYYLASDGMIKYALLTGSGTSRSGGALDEDDFRLTLKLMPSAIRTRKQQMAFVIDPDVHNTALSLAALKTQDVRGSVATLDSGVITNIWGVDVFESGFILGSNSTGTVAATPGALGRLVCVYAPYWAMGWKRHITIETARDIDAQANIIVATMRLGFKYRGAGSSTITYNLTIA